MKRKSLPVYLTEEEHARLRERAKKAGRNCTMSDYLVQKAELNKEENDI